MSGKFNHQNLRFIEKSTRILWSSPFYFFITAAALRFGDGFFYLFFLSSILSNLVEIQTKIRYNQTQFFNKY